MIDAIDLLSGQYLLSGIGCALACRTEERGAHSKGLSCAQWSKRVELKLGGLGL